MQISVPLMIVLLIRFQLHSSTCPNTVVPSGSVVPELRAVCFNAASQLLVLFKRLPPQRSTNCFSFCQHVAMREQMLTPGDVLV